MGLLTYEGKWLNTKGWISSVFQIQKVESAGNSGCQSLILLEMLTLFLSLQFRMRFCKLILVWVWFDMFHCFLPCSSVHMEESSVMQGAQGMLVQNWPTVSSAAGEWTSSSQKSTSSILLYLMSSENWSNFKDNWCCFYIYIRMKGNLARCIKVEEVWNNAAIF